MDAAACALLHCSKEFAKGTAEKVYYETLEKKGSQPQYAALRKWLAGEQYTISYILDPNTGEKGSFSVSLFQYNSDRNLTDNISYIDNKYQIITRGSGLVQAAGGAAGIISGGALCSGGVTCAAGTLVAAYGADNLRAGADTLISGRPVKTVGAELLETLGVSPEYSELIYTGAGFTAGSASLALKSVKTGEILNPDVSGSGRVTKGLATGHNQKTGKGEYSPGASGYTKDIKYSGNGRVAAENWLVIDEEAAGWSQYNKYRNSDGSWRWPEKLGFAEEPVRKTLPVGTRLDRYGNTDGSFFSPKGTPYEQRALAPGAGKYHEYEVTKELPVIQGKVAPAFDESGGGIQILPNMQYRVDVDWLLENKYIKEVE